ncbi:MAG: ferredoxin family protein [Lachnospiraceae bacterium]|nr:ferredoxin family protein [Lachnospiraceae bacterium]MCD8106221.1 ferredoxin family protein [Lachnospiraceae bacterium]
MSVIRADLNKCIGCQRCFKICPMDVFRFDYVRQKSVIAYPESCQSCGQCYLNCPAHSLGFTDGSYQQSVGTGR